MTGGGTDGESLTYAAAGVDVAAGEKAVELIKQHVRSTFRPEVIGDIGGFGGLFAFDPSRYREPVLVSSTDGVGTKALIAEATGRFTTIGIDLVAMCVDDVVTQGAEPLFFQDYIAVGRLVPDQIAQLVEGVADGCRQAGCALIGGETAELPDLYAPGEYDLAGFAVGIVERARLVDGAAVKPGDVVLGLASSGLHSNGYSLARRIVFDVLKLDVAAVFPGTGRAVADELLEPTRIYVRAVLPIRAGVHAMAHVTGGGITGNLPRVLPDGCRAMVRRRAWTVPPVFETLRAAGRVDEAEMFRTFNMGIGYLLVLPPDELPATRAALAAAGETVFEIGEIVAGPRGVELV